ncbi:MAG: hypothetical protein RMJ66_00070 [Bacteroidia bacterium]|nr:hypothetical protein [Bacteroidia bacterium]MDW8133438.1 hypothetical protein [Bacteroidia bacterium]
MKIYPLLRESIWFASWWWRVEIRRGQALSPIIIFLLSLFLLGGMVQIREKVPDIILRLIFWTNYFYSLFLTLPRALLERRPEEWRWIYYSVSESGGLGGLWLYALSWTLSLGLVMKWGVKILWDYYVPLHTTWLGGGIIAFPLLLITFISAKAEVSYAITAVLVFPVVFLALLSLVLSPIPSLFSLIGIWVGESLLLLLLGPYVWRN